MATQSSYSRTRQRLEEIAQQIKAKDTPLEKSLDLYEEALRLGSTCAEMVDRTDFSADELAQIDGDEQDFETEASGLTDADSAADVTDAAALTQAGPAADETDNMQPQA